MSDEIEISVGDVNDVEARVYARYVGDGGEGVELKGRLSGPFCEGSRTLPARIEFRNAGEPGQIEALVPDPCTWSRELPHVYRVDVEARQGERIVAAYEGEIGLRRGG